MKYVVTSDGSMAFTHFFSPTKPEVSKCLALLLEMSTQDRSLRRATQRQYKKKLYYLYILAINMCIKVGPNFKLKVSKSRTSLICI